MEDQRGELCTKLTPLSSTFITTAACAAVPGAPEDARQTGSGPARSSCLSAKKGVTRSQTAMQNAIKDMPKQPTGSTERERGRRSNSLKGIKVNTMDKGTSETRRWVWDLEVKMEMRGFQV